MRWIYSVLFYCALPLIFARLLWRSLKQPGYRHRFAERLGFYPFQLERCVWVHAVSVGETLAAIPLIKELQNRYPQFPILVTTMTPTGTERLQYVFKDSIHHVYMPYDLPTAVQRFLTAMKPKICIIMETELWPNVLAACKKRNIPACLVNARLSEKSAKGYERISFLSKEMMQNLTVIAAHGFSDAERFIQLGAAKDKVTVTGNLKFDLQISDKIKTDGNALRQELNKEFTAERFIWIAASTHEGEEEIIIAAHKLLRAKNPDALLILVPRHPDRFLSIAKLCEQSFKTAKRSKKEVCDRDTEIYLGDTMGELLVLYAASDVAFVGGSLIQRGGHNILEPAALAKALISGEHLFNFAEISELYIRENALQIVKSEHELAAYLIQLSDIRELRVSKGQKALEVMSANRGALEKQLTCIDKVMREVS